jgi:hypothetical protein
MKMPLISLMLILWAMPSNAATITKWQEKQVLTALSSYCGTSWCEGDFDYKFKSLKCKATSDSCRLGFTLVNRTEKTHSKAECDYSPVRNFREIMTAVGGPEALNDGFLEALDDCFEKAEARAAKGQ